MPGVDNVTVKEFKEYLRLERETAKERLLKGHYKPRPVRRVEIPKD